MFGQIPAPCQRSPNGGVGVGGQRQEQVVRAFGMASDVHAGQRIAVGGQRPQHNLAASQMRRGLAADFVFGISGQSLNDPGTASGVLGQIEPDMVVWMLSETLQQMCVC